jgi:hypothetical protein
MILAAVTHPGPRIDHPKSTIHARLPSITKLPGLRVGVDQGAAIEAGVVIAPVAACLRHRHVRRGDLGELPQDVHDQGDVG